MPFESEKQRRWMWANKPEMARRWEHDSVGKYSIESNVCALIFDKTFDKKKAEEWARKHDFRGTTQQGKKIRIKIKELRQEDDHREVRLAPGVVAVIVMPMLGKFADGAGPQLALRDSALPDFKTIYYQPVTDEDLELEAQQQATRRQQLAKQNSGRFGLYGAANPKPIVRYTVEDYPTVSRQNNTGNAPRFIVRGTSKQNLRRKDPAS